MYILMKLRNKTKLNYIVKGNRKSVDWAACVKAFYLFGVRAER